MPTAKRQALVVLGMHRSGTSATAGVLSLLGVSQPRHLMPPTTDNPKGYWESVLLMKFHEELLHAGESTWDDWSPIADSWFDSATAMEARAQIPAILSEEFGDAAVLLLKDPRLCRLMPLWAPVLRDQDIEPFVVLTMRDALDVAQSLRARDDFDMRRGLLLWLRHVLDAEYHTRSLRRTFIRYDDLLADWRPEVARMTTELRIDWPRPPEDVAHDIDQLLDRSLRHHETGGATGPPPDGLLGSWVAAVSDAFTQLCQPGADTGQAVATLDGVRAQFDRAATTFRGALRDEFHQLHTSVSDTRAELARVNHELETGQQSITAAHAELARVNRELETGQQELTVAQAALKEEQCITARHAARISGLEGKLVVMHRQTQAQVEELAMLTRRMLRAEARVGRVTAQREREVSRLRARMLRAEARVGRVTAQRKREVSRLRAQMSRQKVQIVDQGQHLIDMQESTSWRMTAPLRSLSGRVRASHVLPAKLTRKD